MKLCLDACVALQMLLPEDNTEAALALQKEIRDQLHELIAPDTLPIEIAHDLTKVERQGKIPTGSAKGILDGFLNEGTSCPWYNSEECCIEGLVQEPFSVHKVSES
jgi:predicted nucleic acid-binding protein